MVATDFSRSGSSAEARCVEPLVARVATRGRKVAAEIKRAWLVGCHVDCRLIRAHGEPLHLGGAANLFERRVTSCVAAGQRGFELRRRVDDRPRDLLRLALEATELGGVLQSFGEVVADALGDVGRFASAFDRGDRRALVKGRIAVEALGFQ